MAVGKPLLCVKSDESCLEATIRNTRSGLAARTAEEAFRFILHHYQFWQDNGYTHINTDKEAVERFSRKKQAEQFMRIFTRLNSSAPARCEDHLTLFRIRTCPFARTGSHLRKGILLQAAYGAAYQYDPAAL